MDYHYLSSSGKRVFRGIRESNLAPRPARRPALPQVACQTSSFPGRGRCRIGRHIRVCRKSGTTAATPPAGRSPRPRNPTVTATGRRARTEPEPRTGTATEAYGATPTGAATGRPVRGPGAIRTARERPTRSGPGRIRTVRARPARSGPGPTRRTARRRFGTGQRSRADLRGRPTRSVREDRWLRGQGGLIRRGQTDTFGVGQAGTFGRERPGRSARASGRPVRRRRPVRGQEGRPVRPGRDRGVCRGAGRAGTARTEAERPAIAIATRHRGEARTPGASWAPCSISGSPRS